MSGPKSNCYALQREPLRLQPQAQRLLEEQQHERKRQRQLQYIHIAILELEKLHREIEAAATQFPDENFNINFTIPDQPDQHSLQALETFYRQLDHVLREGRQAFTLAIDRARTNTSLLTTLRSALSTLPEKLITTSSSTKPPQVDAVIEEQLEKALAPIANRPPDEWPQEILTLISVINDRSLPTSAHILVLELRSRIQNFLHEEKQQIVDRGEAERLLVELPRGSSQEEKSMIDELSRQLCRIIAGQEQMTDDLRQRVTGLHEAAEQDFDRQVASEVIKDTLKELGYHVGESFNTLLVDGGAVHFQRPTWGKYYVRMRINPQTEELRVHLVKDNQPGNNPGMESEKDLAMESAWCADYHNLMQTLQDKGIVTTSIHHLAPGAVPVPLMHPLASPSRERENRRDLADRHPKRHKSI